MAKASTAAKPLVDEFDDFDTPDEAPVTIEDAQQSTGSTEDTAVTGPPPGTVEAQTAPGSKQRRTSDQRVVASYLADVQRLARVRGQYEKAVKSVEALRPEFENLEYSVTTNRKHPAVIRYYDTIGNIGQ